MRSTKRRENLRALVETAILIAIGYVLSFITMFRLPQGGSVTPLSMLPLLLIGLRHGLKWGLAGCFVYSGLQMLQGFYPPPSGTFQAFIAVIMLDYVLAFTVLGLSGLFRGNKNGMIFAVPLCLISRFILHFISGVVIWGYYITEQHSVIYNITNPEVLSYSLIYNGTYMGPELVITMIVGALLCKTAPMLFSSPKMQEA